MIGEALAALEGSAPAVALRGSTWVYPLVNAGHILGIGLLFGAIAPLDLRLLGFWRKEPVAALERVLVPVAVSGFILAAVTGALLFMTDARDYAASPVFRLKLVLLVLGLANVALYRAVARSGEPAALIRLAAGASLALWTAVIISGRLVGYF